MPLKAIKSTPRIARIYLFAGLLLIALPSIAKLYDGHTGKFLVVAGSYRDEMFRETVIYLNRHDIWGAHGTIINRPARREDFRTKLPEFAWNADVYSGGPVWRGETAYVLIDDPKRPSGFKIESVDYMRKHNKDLVRKFDARENEKPVRLYAGYAGWFSFQLNREISRGGWYVIDYDPALMFETLPDQIWKKAMEKVLEKNPDVAGQL